MQITGGGEISFAPFDSSEKVYKPEQSENTAVLQDQTGQQPKTQLV
jgi:hypothetical protein